MVAGAAVFKCYVLNTFEEKDFRFTMAPQIELPSDEKNPLLLLTIWTTPITLENSDNL